LPGLTLSELELISNVEVLDIKRSALAKIHDLLSETKEHLHTAYAAAPIALPRGKNVFSGKISRGENYRGLPYMILDFPAYFSQQDIFAFRTMFWWGHFFSVTLHLQGKYFHYCQKNINDNFDQLLGKSLFISIAKTPWEYHYAVDNYILLEDEHRDVFGSLDFLKLSIQIPLERSRDLPGRASDFYHLMGDVVNV